MHLEIGTRLQKYFFSIQRYFIGFFCSFVYKLIAKACAVQIGHNVAFNGRITFDRFKYSTILIGNNCTFNSNSLFNPRGIRHCILHTATDYARIEIGNNCGFSGVSIVSWKSITIGDNVMVGADTCIGDTDDHPERLGTVASPVKIMNNVFIGMHCIILKGVTIGENSIIGAGSVVTRDIPANCIAAGVPCKVIRYL